MASIAGTGISVSFRPPCYQQGQVIVRMSGLKLASFSRQRKNFPAIRLQQTLQFRVSCAAKPETLDKVCEIVKKQLALPQETSVTGASTFTGLGADSLDTVEIVMGLEEAFGIVVEEDNAQSITTVQDAADLIEDLVEAKSSLIN